MLWLTITESAIRILIIQPSKIHIDRTYTLSVGAVSNRTIGVNLGISQAGRFGFLTEPDPVKIGEI